MLVVGLTDEQAALAVYIQQVHKNPELPQSHKAAHMAIAYILSLCERLKYTDWYWPDPNKVAMWPFSPKASKDLDIIYAHFEARDISYIEMHICPHEPGYIQSACMLAHSACPHKDRTIFYELPGEFFSDGVLATETLTGYNKRIALMARMYFMFNHDYKEGDVVDAIESDSTSEALMQRTLVMIEKIKKEVDSGFPTVHGWGKFAESCNAAEGDIW